MSSIYYTTAGTPLADILPLESNGPGNQSTPRLILDVEFLDKVFLTPTDAFVVNDDVSARFVNGFVFDVVGGPYANTYVVDLTGFAPGDVVAQVVDGKTHIPVANITSTAIPYDFATGFISPSISPIPGQPGNYHVTWQLAGNISGVVVPGAEVLFKHIIYNGTRLHRMDTVISVTYTGAHTNIVTSLYDPAPVMPIISVDTQSAMVSPVPAVTDLGYVQYTISSVATSLMLVGRGAPMYNDTITWGNAMQSNMIHMLENFADNTAPAAPLTGQLWYDASVLTPHTVPALKLYENAAWSEIVTLSVGDNAYIAKTGGYNADPTVRSGTMTGDLALTGTANVLFKSSGSGDITFEPTTSGGIDILGTGGINISSGDVVLGGGTNTVSILNNGAAAGSIVFNTSGATTSTGNNVIDLGSNMVTGLTNPVGPTDAVNLLFADSRYVNVTGDTMTGHLTLNADPTASLHAATKSYVDMFVSGIIWLRPVLDPSLFSDALSSPPVDDGFDKYHRTYIVAAPGTGDWTGLDGHLVAWDGASWLSVLGRPVQAGDRFGVFCSPDNDDPLLTLPGGGLSGHAGKIAEVTGVAPYAYSFYVPAEPDAFSVIGVPGSAPYQSPHMGHSYTFRGQYGVGTYGADYSWIVFSGPQMLIDGAGLKYDANVLNTDGKVRSLYDLNVAGLVTVVDVDTVVAREIVGTTGNVVVLDGNGLANNPRVDLATVTQSNTGTSFVKVRLDAYGRVDSNAPVAPADIISALGYTPADDTDLTSHINDTTDAHTASAITNVPAGNVSATTVQGAINELDTEKVAKAGDTMTGVLDLGGNAITSLASPSAATDAANKAYVDAVAQGLAVKPAVKAATTTNLVATYYNGAGDDGIGATLTSTTNGVWPGLDGVTTGWIVTSGVLVKDQSASLQNGRYYVSDLGSGSTPWVLTRCHTCDESHEIPSSFVFVQEGTQSGTGWAALTGTPLGVDPNTFEVGYDVIVYTQFSGAGTYVAGSGLSLTGTTFDVNVDGTTIEVNSDTLRVVPNTYVRTVGDTMTGALMLSGDPTTGLHAATKQYVDTARVMALAGSVNGTVPASAKVLLAITAQPFTIPATPNATPCYGYADVVSTGSAVFNVQKNGVNVGTMTFSAGVNAAAFTFGSLVSFAAGDRIAVVAPGTADATLADVYFTIRGTLV